MSRRKPAARAALVRRLLAERHVESQDDLVALLAEHGHRVTQATVSRDLASIGAVKAVYDDGGERYVVPPEADIVDDEAMALLADRLREFVQSIDHSANNVVIKTPPGLAGAVAAALDAAPLEGVLGTLGGDDTVLVVTRATDGGARVTKRLRQLLEAS